MTARARSALGVLLALGGAAALAGLSFVPYTAEPADHAVLRLAWRARGERVHECRRLTPQELERLPPHMRREEICSRRIVPYRLQVVIDGSTMVDEWVRARGAREDRPLFVFRDVPVPAGTHRVVVTFERETGGAPQEERESERERAQETPPRVALEEVVTLGSRQIVLVTYIDETRALRLLAAPRGGP